MFVLWTLCVEPTIPWLTFTTTDTSIGCGLVLLRLFYRKLQYPLSCGYDASKPSSLIISWYVISHNDIYLCQWRAWFMVVAFSTLRVMPSTLYYSWFIVVVSIVLQMIPNVCHYDLLLRSLRYSLRLQYCAICRTFTLRFVTRSTPVYSVLWVLFDLLFQSLVKTRRYTSNKIKVQRMNKK